MRNKYLAAGLAIATFVGVAWAVVWAKGLFSPGQWQDPLLSKGGESLRTPPRSVSEPTPPGDELATFAGGCFWCTEAMFQRLKGVHSVVSGYSGGDVANPSYEQVCTGTTGHAEAIQITYDPKLISYEDLLEAFWQAHDPTTLNRQGHDVGTQYRSAIFYHTCRQEELALEYKKKLDASGAFAGPIVTEIVPFSTFYPAENYHQNFYLDNPGKSYCTLVIQPKLEKFDEVFRKKLKHP